MFCWIFKNKRFRNILRNKKPIVKLGLIYSCARKAQSLFVLESLMMIGKCEQLGTQK